jgi:DNA-binding MarR family transcriptional regulator
MSEQATKISGRENAVVVREDSVGWMLKALSSELDDTMKQVLKPLGLSLGQFSILMTLLESDAITQSEIGKRISMPDYATTRNLDVLEGFGFLERHRDGTSRRSFSIRLTKEGKAIAPKLFSIVRTVNETLLSPLNDGETEQFKDTLRVLLRAWRGR